MAVGWGGGGVAFALDATRPLPPGVSLAGISEGCSSASPVSLYGATKLAAEILAIEYAYAAGTPLVIDRLGVMAGAGQFGRADQGIFSWWIHRWAARRPLSWIGFGGRGLQVRDCLHPDDLAEVLLSQLAAARGGEDGAAGSRQVEGLRQGDGWPANLLLRGVCRRPLPRRQACAACA